MAPPLARDRVLGSAHLLSRVLEGLTPAELARAAAVSPLWRAAGRSPDLWRAHLLARRPAAPAAAAGVQPRLAAAAAPPWRLYAARARTLLRPRAWTLADYTCTVDVWLRGPDDGDDDDGGAEPGGGPSLSAAGRWGADGAKSHAAPGARLRLAISDSKHYLNEVEWPQFAVDVIILRSDGLAWAASSCPPDGSSCCLLQPYENAGGEYGVELEIFVTLSLQVDSGGASGDSGVWGRLVGGKVEIFCMEPDPVQPLASSGKSLTGPALLNGLSALQYV